MPTPDLDLTICVLEFLIERYGINRSLSNILASERSIRKERRKRQQEQSSSDPFPYDEATELVIRDWANSILNDSLANVHPYDNAAILDDPNKLPLEKFAGFYPHITSAQGLSLTTGKANVE